MNVLVIRAQNEWLFSHVTQQTIELNLRLVRNGINVAYNSIAPFQAPQPWRRMPVIRRRGVGLYLAS